MGLRPPLGAAPPPAAPLRVSTAAEAAGPPHARGRRLRPPPGSGRDGCEGSGAAPPGPAFTRSPRRPAGSSGSRGCGRSGRRRRKRRVRGRHGGRPPPMAPRRGPCCRGTGPAGVRERRAAAALYIARGAAPLRRHRATGAAPGGLPACPRRRSRRLPAPSLPPPIHRPTGGAGPPRPLAPPRSPPVPPSLPLQASGRGWGWRAAPLRRLPPQPGGAGEMLGSPRMPPVPAGAWGRAARRVPVPPGPGVPPGHSARFALKPRSNPAPPGLELPCPSFYFTSL